MERGLEQPTELATCPGCSHHFQVDPRGDVQSACPDCGRQWFNQPSPTQSDGTLRDMVDSDTQKDQGGNPLGEGTIMGRGAEKPLDKRDNYMHGHVIAALFESSVKEAMNPLRCTHCGEEPIVDDVGEAAYCENCNREWPIYRDEPWNDVNFIPQELERAHHYVPQVGNDSMRGYVPTNSPEWLDYYRQAPRHQGAITQQPCADCGVNAIVLSDGTVYCPNCKRATPPAERPPEFDIHDHSDTWRTPGFPEPKGPNFLQRMFSALDDDDYDPREPSRWDDPDHAQEEKERREKSGYEPPNFSGNPSPEERPDLFGEGDPIDGLMWGSPHLEDERFFDHMDAYYRRKEQEGQQRHQQYMQQMHEKAQGPLNDPAHPDPWMDNEPGTLTFPQHWTGKRREDMNEFERHSRSMEPYESLWEHVAQEEQPEEQQQQQQPVPVPMPNGGGLSVPGIGGLMQGVMGGGGEAAGTGAAAGAAGGMAGEAAGLAELAPALLLAHYETPGSNPDVGTKHDDPEEVDQKEFNDQDHSPKNIKNPETGEPGGATSGEPGHDKEDMDNFADGSPAVETLNQLLPLLLHFFNSDESGANHPAIKGLHEMLEAEHPGYLDKADPQHAEIVIQTLQPKHAIVENPGMAGTTPEMIGAEPQAQMPNVQQPPGGNIQSGHCPNCGGALDPGTGGCPMCGQRQQATQQAQQSMVPGSAFVQQSFGKAANHQGPTTPEQIAVVQQWLIENGRQEEVPNVPLDPGNPEYVKILSEIQGRANVAPPVSPQEATPPPPPAPPGGSMPVPGMGGGEPGGQPMQPMSSVDDDSALFFGKIGEFLYPDVHEDTHSSCPTCGGPGTPLGQLGRRMHYRCRNCGMDFSHEEDPAAAEQAHWEEDPDYLRHNFGRVGADNVAERCPECGSGTTGMVGDEENTQHCHACGHKWKHADVINDASSGSTSFSHVAAPVVNNPNPVDAPAAEQASPLDIQPNEDSGLTWKDDSGEPLQAGQTYMMKSTQYPIPDMIKIMRVKPDGLEVNIVGTFGNEPNALHTTEHVTREEMQANKLTFTPAPQNADDHNAEPPPGAQAPGLPPQQETTDERTNAYPPYQSNVCTKCGHADGDVTSKGHRIAHTSTMIATDATEYECGKCGNQWIAKEANEGPQGQGEDWVNPSAEWIREGDDSWSESDRQRMMASSQHRSRSLSDIPRDRHSQEVKSYLDEQKGLTKEAGRYFSPLEQRGLIDEDGVARNSDLLNLDGTHYKSSTEAGQLDPDRVPFEHILFGL